MGEGADRGEEGGRGREEVVEEVGEEGGIDTDTDTEGDRSFLDCTDP